MGMASDEMGGGGGEGDGMGRAMVWFTGKRGGLLIMGEKGWECVVVVRVM